MLRHRDVLARWGGEEFVVLFPETTLDQARTILDRMAAVTPSGLTFSAGVVDAAGKTLDEVMAAADDLLYDAKATGRDRVLTQRAKSPEAAIL